MFANPFMLFGIGAVSVPIIIHLLNRRKFERVAWAAMRFLRVSIEQNQRRIKVEDMLLLALRCLLLALLALALARPVLRAAAAQSLGLSKVTAVIVLDNSASMAQTDGVESRFEAAKRAAEKVIDSLPTGSSVAVVLASDQARAVIARPSYDLALAGRAVKEAPLFDRPSNLLPAVQAALEILRGETTAVKRDLYVITDGQASAFRQLDEVRRLLDGARREARAHVVIVGTAEERNLAITDLRVDTGLVPVNQPVRVNVTVHNFSKGAAAADVPVSIAVDSDPPMAQTTIASIPPGEGRTVALYAHLKSEGHHTITAKVAPDRMPADDWRTVALRAADKVKVLVVDGDPGREARESEVFFLRRAIRPVPRAQRDEYHVEVTTRTATELDGLRFEDFAAVFLCNVPDLSPTALAQLAAYVRNGNALAVFLGENVSPAYYNEEMVRRLHLLPATVGNAFGEVPRETDPAERGFAPAGRPYDHELTSIWNDPQSGNLTSVRIYRAYELTPDAAPARPAARPIGGGGGGGGGGDAGSAAGPLASPGDPWGPPRVILALADGRPLLVERNYGLGRVLLMGTTADSAWNNFPTLHAGNYVPFVQRLLGYMVAREDERLTVRTGQPFEHVGQIEYINKDASVTKAPRHFVSLPPEAREVKESRRIELSDAGLPVLRFEGTDFAGPYEVKVGDSEKVIRFAAQGAPEESNLEPLPPDQAKLLDEVANVVRWNPASGADLDAALDRARTGAEFWPYLVGAALALAAVETLLAHWFSKSK